MPETRQAGGATPSTAAPTESQSATPDFDNPLSHVESKPQPETPQADAEPETPEVPAASETQSAEEEAVKEFEWTDEIRERLGFKKNEDEWWFQRDEVEIDGEKVPIVYRDPDDLRRGRIEVEKLFRKYKKTKEAELGELRRRLDEKERELSVLTSRVKPQQLDDVYLAEYTKDELGKILDELNDPTLKLVEDPDDIGDEAKRETYDNALRMAEKKAIARLAVEKDRIQREQQEQQRTLGERLESAKEWYKKNVTPESFGAYNSEEQDALADFLRTDTGLRDEDGKPINLAAALFQVHLNGSEVVANALKKGYETMWAETRGRKVVKPTPPKASEQHVHPKEALPKTQTANPQPKQNLSAEERMRQARFSGRMSPYPQR